MVSDADAGHTCTDCSGGLPVGGCTDWNAPALTAMVMAEGWNAQ